MTEELSFLKQTKPFETLPEEELLRISGELTTVTFDKPRVIYEQHKTRMEGLDLIISGAYETFFNDSNGHKKPLWMLKEHRAYGPFSILLNNGRSICTVAVQKHTRIYRLPAVLFRELCEQYADFYGYFLTGFGKSMLRDDFSNFVIDRKVDLEILSFDRYFTRRLHTVEARAIESCSPQTPANEAAKRMEEKRISYLFIEEGGEYTGYITDIILRNKIVAEKRHSDTSVGEIMARDIYTISREAYVYEAILMMFKEKIRYVIVEENGQKIGVISRSKLLSDQSQSPFVFLQSVRLAISIDELKSKWEQVPEVAYNLLVRGVKSELVNQVITNLSDTISQKVIDGVINEIGPPPARFVFMSLGSEGRKEQTLKTDQDNAIIYEDKANEFREKTRTYFLDFAERVSYQLNYIGFTYCTGGLMAKNPKWTHSLSHWKRNYNEWIENKDPQSVMNFSTFFDCRAIFGDHTLIGELREHILVKLESPSEYFFAQLATNALQYRPPLTFFKGIRTIAKEDQQVFNIKRAMTPIVDLVRVYALKNKILKTNTGERLLALRDLKIFSEEDYHELMQSYYYLMGMRLKQQSLTIMNDGGQPDNFINPSTLTKIEIVTLKEIFSVIESFQQRIRVIFTRNLFG